MCPKPPQYWQGNVVVFPPSPAGLHGLDGDQGNTDYRKKRVVNVSMNATGYSFTFDKNQMQSGGIPAIIVMACHEAEIT